MLLQEEDEQTKLISLHLDNLSFISPNGKGEQVQLQSIQPHRYINLTERGGGNAKKLSFNQRKEVCATLDDEGHLTYWDLVQQTSEEEKDEEMI